MFIGSVPKEVITQMHSIVDFGCYSDAYVLCSGSFRVDSSISKTYEKLRVHSNDVNVLSVAIGKLAVGETINVEFIDKLSFVQEYLAGLEGYSFIDRVAAIAASMQVAKFSSKNEYNQIHQKHIIKNFAIFHQKAKLSIQKLLEKLPIATFTPGDFIEQAKKAKPGTDIVIGFPPTYKGGYERIFKFVNQNIAWEPPEYAIFDPKTLGDFLLDLTNRDISYCVYSDQQMEKLTCGGKFLSTSNKPIYRYVNNIDKSSFRKKNQNSKQFKYQPFDPAEATQDSVVNVVRMDSAQMNFLKNVYLAKRINHVSGMFNYCVFIDGKLAGGIIMALSKYGDIESLYLLSDFSVSRNNRLSKLIAMIATSHHIVSEIEHKTLLKFKQLCTTVFTDKPVSMKYRGIWNLYSRKEGFLNYQSPVRDQSPQQIYNEWFSKYNK